MERRLATTIQRNAMALQRRGNRPRVMRLAVIPVLLTMGACGLFEPKELALCSTEIKKRLKSASNYKVRDYETFSGRISVQIRLSFTTQSANAAPVKGTAVCWHSVMEGGVYKLTINAKTYELKKK